MTTLPRPRSARRPGALLVVLGAALVLLLSACTAEQWDAATRVNTSRAEANLPELTFDPTLTAKAQRWAEQLAAQGYLAHSILPAGVEPGWSKLGENVGSGASIESIHVGFLNSPKHRGNILDPEFTTIGTGVAVSPSGVTYVVQVFARYQTDWASQLWPTATSSLSW